MSLRHVKSIWEAGIILIITEDVTCFTNSGRKYGQCLPKPQRVPNLGRAERLDREWKVDKIKLATKRRRDKLVSLSTRR